MKVLAVIFVLFMAVFSNVFAQELEEVLAEEDLEGPYEASYDDCNVSGYVFEVTVEATESEDYNLSPHKVYNCGSTDYKGRYLHNAIFLINDEAAQTISRTLCSYADYFIIRKVEMIRCEEIWEKSPSEKNAITS